MRKARFFAMAKHTEKLTKNEAQNNVQSDVLTLGFEELRTEPEFVNAEKNLTALGFFTPSSRGIRDSKSKVIQSARIVDGKKIQTSVTIVPAALYGLPVTADQDKYLALQKIIHDRRRDSEPIVNPIGFTTAELLRVLDRQVRAGKNYDEVTEWMKRMTATTIVSEGTVFLAGRKAWASDTFHVFERSVSFGKELPDGVTADRNYVWLSDWQLENINNNHLLPIDFDTYKQLKNHIAKALVPLLQIWLYATEAQGVFEKRYDDLCQHLNIQHYAYASHIRQTLGPALDELTAHGYLASWRLEEVAGERGYKLIVEHGPKYYQDRQLRGAKNLPIQRKRARLEARKQADTAEKAKTTAGTAKTRGSAVNPTPSDSQSAAAATMPLTPALPFPELTPEQVQAAALVSRFYELRYGQPQEATSREIAQAAEMLAQGEDKASHLAEYAAQHGKEGGGFPNDFGGVVKMAAEAGAEFQKSRKKQVKTETQNALKSRQDRFYEAYRAFLELWFTQGFQTAFPAAFAAFCAEEERQRKFHRARAAKSKLSADVYGAFDQAESRINRLLSFQERNADSGIPTFRQWDEQNNAEGSTAE